MSTNAICTSGDAPFCCCCFCTGEPLGLCDVEDEVMVIFACLDPWPPGPAVPLTLLVPDDVTIELVAEADEGDLVVAGVLEVEFELAMLAVEFELLLVLLGAAPLYRMPVTGVTVPSSLSAFWYAGPPSSSATLTMFQPLLLIRGNAFMNALTVLSVSSCSRQISPGLLGPVSHFWRLACTESEVAPPDSPILQSAVLVTGKA